MTTTENEIRAEDTATVCPVCQWPDEDTARCRLCGWELLGGYVAGAATAADHSDIEDRLAAARQRHDVRAAVRAVSVSGGRDAARQSRLSWLAGSARGGPPSASLIQRIDGEMERENTRPPTALPGVEFALTRLVAGEIDGLTFVEIGPDAISAFVLVADQRGVPLRRPAGGSQPWSVLLPGLSAEIDLARFQLAGGVGSAAAGGLDPSRGRASPATLSLAARDGVARAIGTILGAASAEALDAMSDRLPSHSPGGVRARAPWLDTILVRRTRGWPVLDAGSRQAWIHARPIAEIYQDPAAGSLTDIVDLIARSAPLRYAYDLILVKVNARSGAVRIQPRQLFPAATVVRPDHPATATVDVLPPPHAANVIELPIVARRGDRRTDWPLVGSYFIDGTINSPTQLRIRLHRPGELETSAIPALLPAPSAGSGWPELGDRLPERLRPVRALDLAFLVELGGYDEAAVARRIRLIREVVSALRVASASETTVEVAVIGYRDHNSKHRILGRAAGDQLVIHRGLRPAAAAAGILDRDDLWARVGVQDDYAAPLECALRALAEDGLAWRSDARRAVLIVGSRPPHPHDPDDQGSLVRVCPRGSDWRRHLDVIRRNHAVRFLTVVDDPPPHEQARRYIEQAWQEFPAEGLFPINTVSPAQLVQAVGLALDGDATRLSLAVDTTPSTGSRGKGGG
jgi:hypothetical protein